MEINISDEMIEKMVKEQVRVRINQYFAERTKENPFWISDLYRSCASYEVAKVVTNEFARESCKELCKEQIAMKVVDSFCRENCKLF